MAQINIQQVVDRFSTEIGQLSSKLIIADTQHIADLEERDNIIKQQQQEIEELRSQLSPVLDKDSAERVVEGIAESVGDGPTPNLSQRGKTGKKASSGRRS